MLGDITANRLCWVLAGAVLCLLHSACAAEAGRPGAAPAVTAVPAVFAGLPPVPLDGPGARDASALQQTTQNGSAAVAVSSGAAVAGTELILTAAAGSLEYGMYAFAPGTTRLKSIKANFSVSAGDQVWLGLADYGPKRWKFQGPYPAAGTAQLDNLDGGLYLSQAGKCYLLVVAFNATTASVATVQFTTDDAPASFSLSGTITNDASGLALSGVELTLDPGGATAVSDSAGNYTFANVTAGQYTLTPTLAGYTFSPPSYTLDLEGLAMGVDFTATPNGT